MRSAVNDAIAVNVAVIPASRDDRHVIQNLFQLYAHDFAELWAGDERGELPDNGLYPSVSLDDYWGRQGHEAFLIRAAGHLAGFALVNREAHSGKTTGFNMAEYFVVRKHRRTGVGRKAAHMIFDGRRGMWEIAITRRNISALWFWRNAVAAFPGVREIAEYDQNDQRWNGPILRFRS